MRRAIGLKTALKAAPVVLAFALMLFVSWRRWADLIVDYGREVYVPWQLSHGSLLYRDIASFYGPLSNYWNSLLFRVFGESILSIQLFNILLIALLAYIIYRFFESEDEPLAPTVISIAFIVLFALGKHFNLGSYNYVAPYSHELVHGVSLAFAAIYFFKLFIKEQKPVRAFLTGLFTGLVLLAKMEIALALIMAVCAGFAILLLKKERRGPEGAFKPFGLFIAGAALPVIAFIGYFSVYMGVAGAVRSVFSSWTVVAGTGIASSRFYMAVTGMDNLAVNIKGMITAASWYLLLLVPLLINYLLRKSPLAVRYGGIAAFIVTGALLGYFAGAIPWDLLFWPLPVFAAAIAVYSGVRLLFAREDESARSLSLFVFSVFSCLMLLKILFVTRVYGYGFVLAMPATLLVFYTLLSWIPARLKRSWASSGIFRYSVLAALMVMLCVYSIKSYRLYKMQDYAVGKGGDTLVASGFSGGKGVEILLEQIEKVMAPEDDFIMLPEGTFVNYLSRRKNPVKYTSFLPSDMTIYGEGTILAAIREAPPDFIILISRDTIEYGAHYMGQDYGHEIFSFITEEYTDVVRIGNMGFLEKSVGMSQPLGIVIMKRR